MTSRQFTACRFTTNMSCIGPTFRGALLVFERALEFHVFVASSVVATNTCT
eukprot:m.261217 g.261217  ORF g.261217 m.261217 type:complete len:51 (+) comp19692_c0_seq2:1513-1665(+)